MTQTQRKLNRLETVIRIRKKAVDDASIILSTTRNQKKTALDHLQRTQQAYLQGIERLNQERTSLDRDKLQPLETGLDLTKTKWMEIYQQVVSLDRKEKEEHQALKNALTNLKAVDKLEDRYENIFKAELAKAEQKNLDEIALRKYIEGERK